MFNKLAFAIGLFVAAGLANCVSAQTVTTRTLAVISGAGDPACDHLDSNIVLALAVLNNTNDHLVVTGHPIASRCGGVSYANQTLYKSRVATWVFPNTIRSNSVWFMGAQPARGEIALPLRGFQTSSCYATKDTYGNIVFSGSASGMSWRLCVYTMDFFSF